MNKQQLEIAKKIAEIEGVSVIDWKEEWSINTLYESDKWGNGICEYNPFDWSILGPLMVKYGVEIIKPFVDDEMRRIFIARDIGITAKNNEEITQAILECVIKSQEK
jgi:hypothetical protein